MEDFVDPTRLRTVPNFAAAYNGGKGVTRGYIYKLIRAGKLETLEIDGVRFILLPAPTPAAPVAPGAGVAG